MRTQWENFNKTGASVIHFPGARLTAQVRSAKSKVSLCSKQLNELHKKYQGCYFLSLDIYKLKTICAGS